MCFSSSLLITMNHTLLPGSPQRKLNAASSVWYPTPSKFACIYCCWDSVVVFKYLAPVDPSEGHIFPLCFPAFSALSFRLRLSVWLCHKMCPSGQCKTNIWNMLKYKYACIMFDYSNSCTTKRTSHHLTELYKQSLNIPNILFLFAMSKYEAY